VAPIAINADFHEYNLGVVIGFPSLSNPALDMPLGLADVWRGLLQRPLFLCFF